MEIPKNTTQIGEVHGNYKVFIEDYVISYMKQLCRQEPDRKKRIALYGVMRTEELQQYFFIYGGSEILRHGKNDYYLTKQDYEEITWAGEKYFEDYVSLGFVTIEDELPEGICLFNAGKEIYVQGYHIFYEKNESMLTFLIHRQNGKKGESINENREKGNELQQETLRETELREENVSNPGQREKAEVLPPPRQSEVRQMMKQKKQEEIPQGEVKLFGIVKSAAAALFIVLCVTAISTMNGLGKMEGVQNYFQKAFQAMTEKKIPDREDAMPTSVQSVEEESIVEKMQAENLQAENPQAENLQTEQAVKAPEQATVSENVALTEENSSTEETITEEVITEEVITEEVITEGIITEEEPIVTQSEPLTHTIQKGETLISISKAYYGDDSKVQAICELNGIANSDNIQMGQKIILP